MIAPPLEPLIGSARNAAIVSGAFVFDDLRQRVDVVATGARMMRPERATQRIRRRHDRIRFEHVRETFLARGVSADRSRCERGAVIRHRTPDDLRSARACRARLATGSRSSSPFRRLRNRRTSDGCDRSSAATSRRAAARSACGVRWSATAARRTSSFSSRRTPLAQRSRGRGRRSRRLRRRLRRAAASHRPESGMRRRPQRFRCCVRSA